MKTNFFNNIVIIIFYVTRIIKEKVCEPNATLGNLPKYEAIEKIYYYMKFVFLFDYFFFGNLHYLFVSKAFTYR